jgi:hypothetical protein
VSKFAKRSLQLYQENGVDKHGLWSSAFGYDDCTWTRVMSHARRWLVIQGLTFFWIAYRLYWQYQC